MKYLVLLLVILAVIWFLRSSSRRTHQGPGGARRDAAGHPQDMVECPVCLVHLPRTDALAGPDGRFYCCSEHRLRSGG
jgi:uncharacterized protein